MGETLFRNSVFNVKPETLRCSRPHGRPSWSPQLPCRPGTSNPRPPVLSALACRVSAEASSPRPTVLASAPMVTMSNWSGWLFAFRRRRTRSRSKPRNTFSELEGHLNLVHCGDLRLPFACNKATSQSRTLLFSRLNSWFSRLPYFTIMDQNHPFKWHFRAAEIAIPAIDLDTCDSRLYALDAKFDFYTDIDAI